MVPIRLVSLIAAICLAQLAVAGPIPVKVRSWITPNAGETSFAPPPGTFASEANFDLATDTPITIASFNGLSQWITPSGTTPSTATFVQRKYFFDYHAEITDLNSNAVSTLTIPGQAYANWVEGVEGGIFDPQTGVTLGTPAFNGGGSSTTLGLNLFQSRVEALSSGSGPQALNTNGRNVVRVNPDTTGADVTLSVTPLSVPEPGTLVLAIFGLVPAIGALRRRTPA